MEQYQLKETCKNKTIRFESRQKLSPFKIFILQALNSFKMKKRLSVFHESTSVSNGQYTMTTQFR